MMGKKTDKIIKDVFGSFLQRYQKILEDRKTGMLQEVNLFLIVLIYCIINFIK